MWISVADPGCLSWIPDPDFLSISCPGSLILDPGSRNPDLRSWIPYLLDPGTRISDLRSCISYLGSRITDLGSQIPDSGSQISDSRFKKSN
jgi:hypothetical protein